MKISVIKTYSATIKCENISILNGSVEADLLLYYNWIDPSATVHHYDDYDFENFKFHGQPVIGWPAVKELYEFHEKLNIKIKDLIVESLPCNEALTNVLRKNFNI
jgi:hypothetical protein